MTHNTTWLAERFRQVRARIADAEQRFGRAPGSVSLLAVSKTRSAAEIRACAALGQRRFGESYLQESQSKLESLSDLPLEWHFIGPIQSNKTAPIAARFDWVHGIFRLRIAKRLSEQRPDNLPPLNICIQVNMSDEASKGGCTLAELPELAEQVCRLPGLVLRGLMAIPAPCDEFERQCAPFRQLRAAYDALIAAGHPLDTLSMGMSDDLEAAIAEGATIVRVGTALFGERSRKA